MIIEFVGLPGVGKTTYANKLSREEGIIVISSTNRKDRVLSVIYLFILHPITSYWLIFFLFKYHKGDYNLLKHKLFLFRVAVAKEQASRKIESAIIDDGLIQFIYSISDMILTEKEVNKIVEKINLPKRQIINLSCNEKVRLNNLNYRGRVPRARFGKEYAQMFYTALKSNSYLFVYALQNKFTLKKINKDFDQENKALKFN